MSPSQLFVLIPIIIILILRNSLCFMASVLFFSPLGFIWYKLQRTYEANPPNRTQILKIHVDNTIDSYML